jgi:kynurenine formamidase
MPHVRGCTMRLSEQLPRDTDTHELKPPCNSKIRQAQRAEGVTVPAVPERGSAQSADDGVVEMLGRRFRLYDLSDTLSNSTSGVEPNPHSIEYFDHKQTVEPSLKQHGVEPHHWRNGLASAYEVVTASTHSGTHLDAPWHYAPTSGGQPARRVDAVPLEWCCGNGVVLDLTYVDRVRGITDTDVRDALGRAGHEVRPFDVVLIRTDASVRFGEPNYHLVGPGMRRSATQWLVERGVRLIGIDAWGFDRAFDVMAEEARAGDRDQLWEAHYYGAEREYLQIERVSNLRDLPVTTGFFVTAFPFKIEAASASWTRVVAFLECETQTGDHT